MEDLKKMVYESLGTASMCWSQIPQGVFDSTLAQEVGDKLWARIEDEITKARQQGEPTPTKSEQFDGMAKMEQ